jgi:hypothetical protein
MSCNETTFTVGEWLGHPVMIPPPEWDWSVKWP